MAKMGFGDDKIRVQRVFRNKKCSAIIGGVEFHFDSQFERDWAKYLQFLLERGKLKAWVYHPAKFDFWEFGYRKKPYEYQPDFCIWEDEDTYVYQECKGYIETKDISRIRRANKHYDAVFDLVMQRLPKKGKRTQIIAKVSDYAFVRRVIDASKIFKQVKGMI